MDPNDGDYDELLRLLYPDRPPRVPPRFWSPPPDPERPPLTYLPGFKAHIQSHVPPTPFGDPRLYGPWPREHILDAELETLTQTALVVSHPPLEATTAPSDSELSLETAVLTITSHISVGCEGGAQIVVCSVVKDDEPPFEAVAKIFDPLYYRFNHFIASRPRDVTAEADQDYATEATAYEHITSSGRAGNARSGILRVMDIQSAYFERRCTADEASPARAYRAPARIGSPWFENPKQC